MTIMIAATLLLFPQAPDARAELLDHYRALSSAETRFSVRGGGGGDGDDDAVDVEGVDVFTPSARAAVVLRHDGQIDSVNIRFPGGGVLNFRSRSSTPSVSRAFTLGSFPYWPHFGRGYLGADAWWPLIEQADIVEHSALHVEISVPYKSEVLRLHHVREAQQSSWKLKSLELLESGTGRVYSKNVVTTWMLHPPSGIPEPSTVTTYTGDFGAGDPVVTIIDYDAPSIRIEELLRIPEGIGYVGHRETRTIRASVQGVRCFVKNRIDQLQGRPANLDFEQFRPTSKTGQRRDDLPDLDEWIESQFPLDLSDGHYLQACLYGALLAVDANDVARLVFDELQSATPTASAALSFLDDHQIAYDMNVDSVPAETKAVIVIDCNALGSARASLYVALENQRRSWGVWIPPDASASTDTLKTPENACFICVHGRSRESPRQAENAYILPLEDVLLQDGMRVEAVNETHKLISYPLRFFPPAGGEPDGLSATWEIGGQGDQKTALFSLVRTP